MFKRTGCRSCFSRSFCSRWAGRRSTGWRPTTRMSCDHGRDRHCARRYLGTGHFWEATGENWESEFLQMAAVRHPDDLPLSEGIGGVEATPIPSKKPISIRGASLTSRGALARPPRRLVAGLYENSLGLAFVLLFLLSLAIHAIGGLRAYNDGAGGARPAGGRHSRRLRRSARSSGSSRSRTGRANSSRWRRWWSGRSSCGSTAPPNRSRSTRRTPRRAGLKRDASRRQFSRP